MKKFFKSKWFIITLVAVVVAAAGVVFALNFNRWFSPDEDVAAVLSDQIYFNIDGEQYAYKGENGNSSRPVNKDDGYYHILFTNQGRQVTRRCSDVKLVSEIDKLDVMGLVFDEDGIITGYRTLEEMSGKYISRGYYITEVDGDNIVANTSSSLNGINFTFKISRKTKMYDVSGTSGEKGIPVQELIAEDRIIALADSKTDDVTYVFVTDRYLQKDIYWNIDRKYDSKFGMTTREPEADGTFKFLFAVNGHQETLYAKNLLVANQIDSQAGKCLCLTFDEETGLITEAVTASKAINGSIFGSYFNVTEYDGINITVERKTKTASNYGQVQTAKLARNFKVYDVTGVSGEKGCETEVRIGDKTHGIKNRKGEVVVLYVVGRAVDSEFYWNITRMYDSTNKCTTRVPDANGYYTFLFACRGKQVTYKTRDKEIANKVDAVAGRVMGLKLDGDIILDVYNGSSVGTGGVVASWYTVTKVDGRKITAYKASTGDTKEFELAPDCEIYNVSSNYDSFQGEVTTIKVGDVIQGYKNIDDYAIIVHIITRPIDSPIYWNITRKYDSNNKISNRTADPDGYYRIAFAVEGVQKTLKTKDFDIVTQVDKVSGQCMALKVVGDEIIKVYSATSARNCTGGVVASWFDVTAVNGKTISVLKDPSSTASDAGKSLDIILADDCKIFVVNGYSRYCGEITNKIYVGDRVHGYKNSNGTISNLFVVKRTVVEKVYAKTAYCEDCGQVVDWYEWYGSSLYESGHYILMGNSNSSQCNITPQGFAIGGNPTASNRIEVTVDLNGKNITSSGRVFAVNKFCRLAVLDSSGGNSVMTSTVGSSATDLSYGIWLRDDAQCCFYNGTIDLSNVVTTGKNGATFSLGTRSSFTMYGGKVKAASTISTKKGSTISGMGSAAYISSNAIFTLKGGTISGGTSYGGSSMTEFATNAGNFYVAGNGTLNIEGGTVENGTAYGVGGNVYGASGSIINISGGIVTGGKAIFSAGGGHGGNIYTLGKLNISGGEISYGVATVPASYNQGGGNISINNSIVSFTMTGGVIKNGSAPLEGSGNVLLWRSGQSPKFIMSGGLITDDSDFTPESGCSAGGVRAIVGDITISGTAKITGNIGSNLMLDSGLKINATNLTDGAEVYVTADDVFAENAAGYGIYFKADKPGCSVREVDGKLSIGGVYFTESKYFIDINDEFELDAHITDSVTWTSNNATVATVDSTGKVTGKKTGMATITAAANGMNATCNVVVGHYHCLECGTFGCDLHNNIAFSEWTSTNSVPTSGNYYLADNVTVGAQKSLAANTTVNLCLNDKTVTRSTAGRIYALITSSSTDSTGATLSFTDCGTNGTVKPSSAAYNDHGNLFLLSSPNSSLNIYRGTFEANECNYGGVASISSTLNMYGGKIVGGTTNSATSGGTITVFNNGVFNMYDGTITGVKSSVNGGAVFVGNTSSGCATFNMYGGTITGNTADNGAGVYAAGNFNIYGGTIMGNTSGKGAVYIKLGGQFTVSGLVNILSNFDNDTLSSNVYLENAQRILIGSTGLDTSSKIGISMQTPSEFASNALNYDSCFVSDNPNYLIVSNEHITALREKVDGIYFIPSKYTIEEGASQALEPLIIGDIESINYVSSDESVARVDENGVVTGLSAGMTKITATAGTHTAECVMVVGHYHCLECGTFGCTIHENIIFTEWASANSVPTESGNYYFANDITVSAQNGLTTNANVNICLNDHTLSRSSAGRIYALITTSSANSAGATLSIADCGTGGTIKPYNATYNDQGNLFFISSANTTLNLYGGTLEANKCKYGGVISIATTFNMYGGKIVGGVTTDTTLGGAVYVSSNGVFNMYGGEIVNGTSANGGNIYARNNSQINLYGGTVSGGTATNGTSSAGGGNIYLTDNAKLSIIGATVKDGTAYGVGGNISGAKTTILNLESGIVTGGTAKPFTNSQDKSEGGHGGNMYVFGTANMSGGEISNGIAESIGGGNVSINNSAASFNMTGGVIKNGISKVAYKGNVIVWNTAGADAFKMSGGTITQDSSFIIPTGYYGGGVYVNSSTGTVVKLSGNAVITGNNGANLYLGTDRTLTLESKPAAGFNVGITMQTPGTFVSSVSDDLSSYFTSDNNSYTVSYSDGSLALVS